MEEAQIELAQKIRWLMRGSRSAFLSTVTTNSWPYGSMVTVAIDQDASPLLLMSTLSDHTRNLEHSDRGALLFSEPNRHRNPQRSARATVMGRIRKTKKTDHAARFHTMHPEAMAYSGFGDFDFYRMNIDRVHWIGGFAQARWLRGKFVKVKSVAAEALKAAESSICQHMNKDHREAIDLFAQQLLKRRGTGWRMVGIDSDGADLERDGWFVRLNFLDPINGPLEARAILVKLATEARRQ